MIQEGTLVKWKWGNGTAKGTVKETHAKEITKTLDGSEVTRNGEEDNKALIIEQKDGTLVLKLESEVQKA